MKKQLKYETPKTILSWAEEDRPREKLILKGKSALTDAELLAILIGSGTQHASAVDVARQLLKKFDNDLSSLARLEINQLTTIKGIGLAKAVRIATAFELGRRRKSATKDGKVRITNSKDVYRLMGEVLHDEVRERFWVVLLNRANIVINKIEISSGGVSGTVADPKMIFKYALEYIASGIILVHNHPSGNRKPSEADIKLTKKIKMSAEALEIQVLDHLIYTDDGYLSFADEGLM